MQARVVDTIHYHRGWISAYPVLLARGEGVMAVFDIEDLDEIPMGEPKNVELLRPDGSCQKLVVHSWEQPDEVVGAFFLGLDFATIPRLSVITW